MTQQFLLSISLSGCLHAQRLLRAPEVVELDPVADHAHGVLLDLEAVPMGTLLLHIPLCWGSAG